MRIVDSHTEGEPTRVIVEGGPDLGAGSMADRRRLLAERHDDVRAFALNEPRGFEAMVGALLCAPVDPENAAGLIFFNNVGYLGMCGHATIGAAVTLAHLGRIGPGRHRFETPVGLVSVELEDRNTVAIDNVPAYLHRRGVELEVEGRWIRGDIAWGGNWFFLTEDGPCPIEPGNIATLMRWTANVRAALIKAGVKGSDGAEVDHIEVSQPGANGADSRNFVLCPGGVYDRSPCGTGTSAKLACLAASGALAPGATYVQESVIGGRFEAKYQIGPDGAVLPIIRGRAFVTAEGTLIRDPRDPFPNGLPPVLG